MQQNNNVPIQKGADNLDKDRLEENPAENEENIPQTAEQTEEGPRKCGFFRRLGNGIADLFARLGLCAVKVFARILLILIRCVSLVFSELKSLISAIFRGIIRLVRALAAPFAERMKFTEEMQKNLRRAKKEGGRVYRNTLIKSIASFLLGENGVCYTAFNYILPIVSAAFLIGVVRYSSGLEYGLSVEYNGKRLGVISAEADFETAARDVSQRISYTEDDEQIDFSSKLSLEIIPEGEKLLTASQLANEMLAVSNRELSEAVGIYIDGEFIGAVKDEAPVKDALDDILLNFKADGIVRDVSFKNKIEYSEGIYLTESVMEESAAIELLTSKKEKNTLYVVKKGESPVVICQKHNMELEDFERLNPYVTEPLREGQFVNVTETESYLPIQYVREMESLSFLDYETIEVKTSSLNVGTTAVLVKGERGEKRSNIEITYIDGVERSRKTVSSVITKQPVVEQIGIGTYTAKPSSSSTKLYGNGMFGWPVNGGYVSDPFISNRNHKGLDIAAPGGTDIYAAADGVVVSAGWNTGGYGYFVMIEHFNGYQTIYGHCSALYAIEGQTVTRGQLIAAVGTTGQSTGNHCHFEVRSNGMCCDPALFINTVNYEDE